MNMERKINKPTICEKAASSIHKEKLVAILVAIRTQCSVCTLSYAHEILSLETVHQAIHLPDSSDSS